MLRLVLFAISASVVYGSCNPLKLGCFIHSGSDRNLLHSDNSEDIYTDFYSGTNIEWDKFSSYLQRAACRCDQAAANAGYRFFSLRDFGECHGIGKGASSFDALKLKKSMYCIAPNLGQCDISEHQHCTGAEEGEFIYETKAQPAEKVIDGGYSSWSAWSICSKECDQGLQERQRTCTNPEPKGKDAKDCSKLGKPSETRSCKIKDCPPSGETVIFCEHRGVKRIACENDQVVEILAANYGRTSTKHCVFGRTKVTNCRAAHSMSIVKSQCDGFNYCDLNPHNDVFGNPCGFYTKYLEVKFRCVARKTSSRRAVLCEHRGSPPLSCPNPDEVLSINKASYGRLSTHYCQYGHFKQTNCRALHSDALIKKTCNGLNSCSLNPSNTVYGNPCGNVNKYISVEYTCKKTNAASRQAVFCEHQGGKTLKCANPDEVLSINKANYGRLSTDHCQFGHFKQTNCRAEQSDALIKLACNGLNECSLNPSNDVYGNPCGNVRKYISVDYTCKKANAASLRAVFCEHQGVKTLKCANPSQVLSITKAIYGRLSTDYCQLGLFKQTNCRAANSDGMIKKQCNGKNSCQLNPSNAVYGDPCKYVRKYISVEYKCINK